MTVILHALSYLAVIAAFVFGLLSLGPSALLAPPLPVLTPACIVNSQRTAVHCRSHRGTCSARKDGRAETRLREPQPPALSLRRPSLIPLSLVQVEILLLAALYAVDGLPLHLVSVGILAHVV